MTPPAMPATINTQGSGVPASPSGSRPSDGAEGVSTADAASIPNAVYARSPKEGVADYLTPNHAYLVMCEDEGGGFFIINDMGTESYCLWKHCGHLYDGERRGSWTRETGETL